ncbi:MAG: outer membrane protein [Yoonia sp.]|jgi:outer membrane protein
MKTITTIAATAMSIIPAFASAQEAPNEYFSVTVSGGLIATPSFLGSSETDVFAIPNITMSYGDRLTVSLLEGLSYDAYQNENLTVGALLKYDFGREDSPADHELLLSDVADAEITGLGDIDGTIEVGGYVEYTLGNLQAKLEVRTGVDGGHDGTVGEFEVAYNMPVEAFGMTSIISFGPTVSFSDDSYASTFFDVSAAQSAASGISQYDADGGIMSYGLHASAFVPLNQNVSLVGFAEFDKLAGDIGDSSIVQERGSEDQVTAGLLINYTF